MEASHRQQWRTVWPGTPTSAALTAARIPDDCRPRLPPQTCCILSLVLEKTPSHALPRRCVDCPRPKENAPTPVGAQSRGCKEGSSHSNWSLHTVYEGFATNSAKRVVLGKADIGSFDLGRIKPCAGFVRVRDVASRSLAHSLTRRGGLLRISPSWRSCVAPPSEIGGLLHANAVE